MLYNLFGKKLGILGNMMVSLCVASTVLLGYMALSHVVSASLLRFVLIVFTSSLVLELSGDIQDAAGDARSGSRSLAVLLIISSGFFSF